QERGELALGGGPVALEEVAHPQQAVGLDQLAFVGDLRRWIEERAQDPDRFLVVAVLEVALAGGELLGDGDRCSARPCRSQPEDQREDHRAEQVRSETTPMGPEHERRCPSCRRPRRWTAWWPEPRLAARGAANPGAGSPAR